MDLRVCREIVNQLPISIAGAPTRAPFPNEKSVPMLVYLQSGIDTIQFAEGKMYWAGHNGLDGEFSPEEFHILFGVEQEMLFIVRGFHEEHSLQGMPQFL